MKTTFLILPILALAGCTSTPSSHTTATTSHADPVIAALRAYHHKFGDYPQQLQELRLQYQGGGNLLYDNHDPKHLWTLEYQRVDQNNYTLYLYSSPCSQAVFKNGTFAAGYGPNYQ